MVEALTCLTKSLGMRIKYSFLFLCKMGSLNVFLGLRFFSAVHMNCSPGVSNYYTTYIQYIETYSL